MTEAIAGARTRLPAQRRLLDQVESFLHFEAASGIVLLVAAAAALIWANSPWSHSYEALCNMPVRLGISELVSTESLHFWINDGLMAIFFLVVGLEIRHELHEGALSSVRQAALPCVAALGGVLWVAEIQTRETHAGICECEYGHDAIGNPWMKCRLHPKHRRQKIDLRIAKLPQWRID